MNPRVSIIMGSTSDLAIMEKAAKVLDDMGIPFEMNALSAHRTPAEVEAFAKQAAERGIEVIIAGAGMAAHLPCMCAAIFPMPVIGIPMHTTSLGGRDSLYSIVQMAAHLPGVIAAMTPVPVIGVPINASLNGMDALLAITQMPPGIPVATVAINGAMNAGILAVQILAVGDRELKEKMIHFKESLKKKIVDANKELAAVKYNFKTN